MDFKDKLRWANVSSMVKEGQAQAHLRSESQDHTVNKLAVPDDVPVVIARQKGKCDEYKRFVAFIELNGNIAVVAYGATRKQCKDQLSFNAVYSMYAPSCYYRSFRVCLGYEYGSASYQTQAERQEGQERITKALLAVLGTTP